MSKRSLYVSVAAGFLSFALAGCASTTNPSGAAYDEPVIPGKTQLLNLTGNPTAEGSSELHFSASSRVQMFVTFRDRLIAFQVDDVDLPGANGGQMPTGYQAIALSPGNHSISYCHTTRSDLGTGLVMCKFRIHEFNFEPNTRYMVKGDIKIAISVSGGQTATVRTHIVKLK